MHDIEDYFKEKTITNLYIKYNDDNKLEYLYNQDRNNDIVEAYFKLNEEKIHYWTVKLNKKPADFIIASGYITKDNIMMLNKRKNSSIVKKIDFDSDVVKDYEYGIYTYKLNNQIDLQFTYEYELRIEENPEFKMVMVYNNDTDSLEYIHYIDKYIYIVEDFETNSESTLLHKQNIKYEFKRSNLSKSDYLQYHQPYRVTNYTTKEQYVMEYDEYGIMTSMVEIGNPEVNLCKYEVNTLFNFGQSEIMSIHPDIYNPFDRSELKTDFLDSSEYVAEKYINVPGCRVYKRQTFLNK